MKYTVKTNKHRFSPLTFGLAIADKLSYHVSFDSNCSYDIGTDQSDINKLFGIGFFPNHHKNSARFGWRWSPEKNKIEILAYVYDRGLRISEFLDDVELNEIFKLTMFVYKKEYIFVVEKNNCDITYKTIKGNSHLIGYHLGPYFGGNKTAPHFMSLELNK